MESSSDRYKNVDYGVLAGAGDAAGGLVPPLGEAGVAGEAGVVAGLGASVFAGDGEVPPSPPPVPPPWQAASVTVKPSPTTKARIFLFIHSSVTDRGTICN